MAGSVNNKMLVYIWMLSCYFCHVHLSCCLHIFTWKIFIFQMHLLCSFKLKSQRIIYATKCILCTKRMLVSKFFVVFRHLNNNRSQFLIREETFEHINMQSKSVIIVQIHRIFESFFSYLCVALYSIWLHENNNRDSFLDCGNCSLLKTCNGEQMW